MGEQSLEEGGIFVETMTFRSTAFFGWGPLLAFFLPFGVQGQTPCGTVAEFTVIGAGQCADLPVSFDVNAPDAAWTYAWTFGDGTGSTEFQPEHVFQNAVGDGTVSFTVSLTVSGGATGPGGVAGCTSSQTVSVLALPDPGLPALSAICLGQDGFPDFDLPASTFSGAGVTQWSVDWGNGTDTVLTDFSPVMDTVGTTYPELGLFGITITATGSNGCVATDADSLFVGTNPTIGSSLPGNSVTVCSPYELTFPILETDNNLPGTEYGVSFGDGNSVSYVHPPPSQVSHTYGSSSCFSNTPGGEDNAYAVTFTANNLCGNATNIVEPIRIHQSPAPDMFGIGDVCAGPVFTYDALGSGLIATPTYCVPAYGDWLVVPEQGQQDASPFTGTGFELNTVFPEPGEYSVYLTESHPNCQDSTGVVPVCVYPDPTEALGTVAPLAGCTPLTIAWENLTPEPELCGQWGVDWWVSGSSSGPDPDWQSAGNGVTFLNDGIYTVTLTIGVPGPARDDCVTVSTSWTITVTEPPVVNFDQFGNVCEGDGVQFQWLDYLEGVGGLLDFGWTVDGVEVSTSTDPLYYVFSDAGFHEVEVFIENYCGVDTDVEEVEVLALPILDFVAPPQVCQGDTVGVEVFGAQNYTWSDAGGIASDNLGLDTVAVVTEFDVTLDVTGTDVFGCVNTASLDIVVTDSPDPQVAGPGTACVGDEMTFTASEPDGADLAWQTAPGGDGDLPLVLTAVEGVFPVTVLATNDVGCTRSYTWVTDVFELPDLDLVSPDPPYCNQPFEEVLPAAYPPGGDWSGAGITNPVGGFDPGIVGEGFHTVLYTYTDGNGCTSVDSMGVTVVEPDTADAGYDQVWCADAGAVPLELFYPPGGAWTGPALVDDVNGIVDVSALGAGDHEWVYHYGVNSCETDDEVMWTVQPLPQPVILESEAGAGPDLCVGDTLFLHVENGVGEPPFYPTWSGVEVLNPLEGADSARFPATMGPGPMIVTVDVLDGNFCTGSGSYTVEVRPLPQAGFSIPPIVCDNENAPWTNTATDGVFFDWSFGTGDAAEGFQPNYTYPEPGFFTVTQTAISAYGCEDVVSQDIEVIGEPVAGFSLDVDEGCAPLPVAVTDTSYAPYATLTWTLQDSVWADPLPPFVVFQQDDTTYAETMSLWVSNQCGTSSAADTLLVLTEPLMRFALLEDTACAPFQPTVVNNSLGAPDVTTWDWGLGPLQDGEEPLPPFYDPTGPVATFPITLTGENQCGTHDTTVSLTILPNTITAFFTLSQTAGCPPLTLTAVDESVGATQSVFDFGGFGFSNDPVATLTMPDPGNYTIRQVATNGCSFDTLEQVVEVYAPPTINLSGVDVFACEDAPTTLTAIAENPGWAAWSFSDGGLAIGLSVEHTFYEPGTFTAVFETEEAFSGCANVDSVEVTVFPAPDLDWQPVPAAGCGPLTVEIDNVSQGALFHQFSFGDGSALSLGASPSHTFVNSSDSIQQYVIHYAAESDQLCGAEDSISVTVLPTPQAEFALDDPSSCGAPTEVGLSNSSFGAVVGQWYITNDLGLDAAPPYLGIVPNWTLNVPGSYGITLIASNDYACSDTTTAVFDVYVPPVAAVSAFPDSGCVPLEVTFADGSVGADMVVLVLDSGVYAGGLPDEGLMLDQPGTYPGYAVAISAEGCRDTLDLDPLTAHPLPSADFVVGALGSGPDNRGYVFSSLDTTAMFYTWDFGDGNGSFETGAYHTYAEAGDYAVSLETQTEFGCKDLEVEWIYIEDEVQVWIPNAFTPATNGVFDGINDAFRPVVRGWSLIDKYEFWVFDRWGNEVFYSQDPEEGWIADFRAPGETTQGDYFMKDGIYNWLLRLTLEGDQPDLVFPANHQCDGPRQFCGTVTVLR